MREIFVGNFSRGKKKRSIRGGYILIIIIIIIIIQLKINWIKLTLSCTNNDRCP